MHCLGAGVGTQANGSPAIPSSSTSNSSGDGVDTGTSESSSSGGNAVVSPTSSTVPGNGSGSKSSSNESVVLGVVRALGILVCEGRIQGLPRGYKEGPHCVPPLAPASTNHQCEKDNYLCDRYLVLVREITERVEIGSYLCVEVVLCSDCPCGLLKSKCKKRIISNVPPTTPWQHTSEMLLEYWCIGIVQSKNPETMMNSQGLYQAVRSRLHFSQVAAWWSRTQGVRPSYIATRLVPHNSLGSDEHLKRFSDTPVEHNFPLANLGDGHYVQVTMWALPRMEDIPCLQCPLHHHQQQEEPKTIVDGCPRASTPSKHLIPTSNNETTGVATTIPDMVNLDDQTNNLQMPVLLDDRLRIDCDQLGKHHCQCADDEEDVHEIPTSAAAAAAAAALVRPNGERKRRRSLPCRPPEPTGTAAPCSGSNSPVLPKLQESVPSPSGNGANQPLENNSSVEGLERSFRTQLSIEDQQECHGNQEKRYKRSESTQQQPQQQHQGSENNTNVPLLIPWLSYSANGHAQASSLPVNNPSSTKASINLVINPFHSYQNFSMTGNKIRGRSAEPELSSSGFQRQQLHLEGKNKDKESSAGDSSNHNQSKLLEWVYRVPGCVLGKDGLNNNNSSSIYSNNNDELVEVNTLTTTVAQMSGGSTTSTQTECDAKARDQSHLKLSPKEFDEVIAVLKARTPMGRKRPGVRIAKRKEKYDRLVNETQVQQLQRNNAESVVADNRKKHESSCRNKADMFMGAILRSSCKETNTSRIGLADISNGTRTPILPEKENLKVMENALPAKITLPPKNNELSLETDSRSKIPFSGYEEPSSPSAFNKRLLRFKQIFKREQEKTTSPEKINKVERFVAKHGSRAKRRIDFTSVNCGNDEEGNEINDSCCNSLAGTSQNRIISDTTSHSTNGEMKYNCYPSKQEKKQQQRAAIFDEELKRKNKQHGKHDLSPIWINQKIHSNDAVGNNESEGCVASELDNYDKTVVPSAKDQERFRRSLENAASMVFHSRTGLPLTSSPAPLRRGHCCFDFDSSLNSVSSKRSALFELNTPPSPGAVSLEEADRETENVCDIEEVTRRRSNSRNRPQSHALLGSFEESALNGRLEPVSTVQGFTAEIGASGAFCPKHRKLPVTVFFYTLGDNDKVSSPYLAHINLGKKGYQVPRSGTIQVTLQNPLGTVVKMFVVLYDLTDMPTKSHTFLRQRTLRDKTLRYLIHLRFMSSKSGRIFLHTDVRMIICRKADVDTASDFGSEPPKELRSYIHGPTNPKFSPRC